MLFASFVIAALSAVEVSAALAWCTEGAFERSSKRPVPLIRGHIDNGAQYVRTFSDSRRDTSAVSARNEPTKYILIKVIARVIHCWKRRRYISASLKCRCKPMSM